MMLNPVNKTLGWMALLAACAVAASSSAYAARIYVTPNPGNEINEGKIQAAVAAAKAGDVILVRAGTYHETQILIDKPLSLWGAGAGETIVDGGGGAGQPANRPGLVRIVADGGNVNFAGFTLQHAGYVGIYASSATPGNRYWIAYNIIYGSNDPNVEDFGLYAWGGQESLVFEHNVVTATGSNAILVELHEGPTDISFNTLDVGVYGADAIFTMTYDALNITSPQKRNNNLIDVGTGGKAGETGTIFDAATRASGITFASSFGGKNAAFSNVQVMRNEIKNVQSERRGISLWNDGDGLGNIIAPQVVKNTISGVGSDAAGSVGIQLLGLIEDAKLINNEISNIQVGIHLRNWKGLDPVGTKIISTKFRGVGENRVISDNFDLGTKQHADHISP